MNKWLITALLLFVTTLSMADVTEDGKGCDLNGKEYSPGTLLPIDKDNPKTKDWHEKFSAENGVPPDGGAFKMMMCSYLVNPGDKDYPKESDRKYVWVAAPVTIDVGSYN